MERARAIYKYALDHIPRAQADAVYKRFVGFEKQHGDRDGIEVLATPDSQLTWLGCVRALSRAAAPVDLA